eukprot:3120557-Rhodomonas_salina.1
MIATTTDISVQTCRRERERERVHVTQRMMHVIISEYRASADLYFVREEDRQEEKEEEQGHGRRGR